MRWGPHFGCTESWGRYGCSKGAGSLGCKSPGVYFWVRLKQVRLKQVQGNPTKLTLQAGTGQAKMVEAKMREPRPDVAGAGIRQLLWVVSLRLMKIL